MDKPASRQASAVSPAERAAALAGAARPDHVQPSEPLLPTAVLNRLWDGCLAVAATNGRIRYANPAFLDLAARSLAQVIDTDYRRLFARRGRRNPFPLTGEKADRAAAVRRELVLPDGSRATVDIRLLDRHGRVNEENVVWLLVRDASSISRSEERCRAVLDGSPLGLVLVDAQGRVDWVNPRYTLITGYTLADMPTADAWGKLAYPDADYRAEVRADWLSYHHGGAETTQAGAAIRYRERRVTCADGKVKTLFFRSSRLDNGSVIITAEDITEKLRTEDRYRALVEQSPLAVTLVSPDGRLTYANARFTDTFGYTIAHIPDNESWFQTMYPDPEERNRLSSDWFSARARMEPGHLRERENSVACADGKEKIIHFRTVMLGDHSLLVTYEDVTAVRRAEAERKLLREQLFRSQKMEAIGTLAAGIAHEINSPMQYLAANVHFLDQAFESLTKVHQAWRKEVGDPDRATEGLDLDFLEQEIPPALKAARDGLERIGGVVSAMRQLTHPGDEKLEEVDVGRVVEQAMVVCRNEFRGSVSIISEVNSDLPPVLGLGNQLSQGVLNLLINAAQSAARRPGGGEGRVEVRAGLRSGRVAVEVADNGPGIDHEVLPRIFEPFFTTKEVGRGTGLGLYIAHKAVVELMGGEIDVHSEDGQGARFTILLPLPPAG